MPSKNQNDLAKKGNKGDWSELYVFAKLLADGKLFQSDIDLNKIESIYYEIIKIYRTEAGIPLEYIRNKADNNVQIFKTANDTKELIGYFDFDYLKTKAKDIYKGIEKGSGLSFNIINANDLIEKAHIKKLTAGAKSKKDIKLRIYDHRLANEADLGFSIKSLLGSDSTLFNAGPGNNFIYEIDKKLNLSVEKFNKSSYKPVGKNSKITFRLQKIINELKLKCEYKSIQSKQLWKNLKIIDGDLPQILGYALLYRYLFKTSSMMEVVKILEEQDPMNFYDGAKSEQKFYEYKLAKFLAECAMGMTSESPWGGIYDATGGVIICKQDGDIICFHIYEFNLFREYLLNNTKFEQPSTGEDGNKPGYERITRGTKKYYFGWLYEENKKLYFKINLQIRFK